MGSPDDTADEGVHDRSSADAHHPMRAMAQRRPSAPDELALRAQKAQVFAALFERPAVRRFGRYVVLGTLGRGGMSTVLKAYDEGLDRAVAIKLLHGDRAKRDAGRLEREAQALARLSHPHVVQVHEVAEADGHGYIAMELVKGQTLTQWAKPSPRPGWRECVRLYLQAGSGLAAAHAKGLVHRDFKPSNALVDDQGHVRVVDFGLARMTKGAHSETLEDRPPDPEAEATALELTLTRRGAVMGTIAYMPPEQMRGLEVDDRSDQFSFCVSLWEALYAERPFAGTTKQALMHAMNDTQVRPAPRDSNVPGRLRRVLLRGLAANPTLRWPTMDALLVELRKSIAPRRRRWVTLGVTAGLAAIGLGLGVDRYLSWASQCNGASKHLAKIEARRADVQRAIQRTGLVYGPDTSERVQVLLEDYAQQWVGLHTEICEATRVRQEQSEEVMDLRMSCLQDHRATLEAQIEVLARADASIVQRAVELVADLPRLDHCNDVERLRARRQRVPPPDDPQVARQAQTTRDRLEEIKAEARAGKVREALEQIEPVVRQADALGYGPLLAEAMLWRGRFHDDNGRYEEAERDLLRAHALAVEHDDEKLEARAASLLIAVIGDHRARPAEGQWWGRAALPLADRVGQPVIRASIANNLGSVLQAQGRYEPAERQHRRAMEILEGALDADHPKIAEASNALGIVLEQQGHYAQAQAQYHRALQIWERALGARHPNVAYGTANIANILLSRGQHQEAEERFRRALRLLERALGSNHPTVAHCIVNIGNARLQQRDFAGAQAQYERALPMLERALGLDHPDVARTAMILGGALGAQGKYERAESFFSRALSAQERAQGTEHPDVATSLNALSNVLLEQHRYEQAERHLRRALQIQQRALGAEHPELATTANNLANVLERLGKIEQAEALHERALRIREHALGEGHPDVAYSLAGLATTALKRGDPMTAAAHAERAVSIREANDAPPPQTAYARFVLAQALWADHAQRPAARELAERARDAFAAHGATSASARAEVDAWLAEHRIPPRDPRPRR